MRLILLLFIFGANFALAQGLNPISKEQLNEIERFENDNLGFSENLPVRSSLEKYVPPVRNQYNTSTCVGFAMGYYAISTIHNFYFDRTTYAEKLIHGFDPFYAYTLNSEDCDEGLNMIKAFRLYSNVGAKKEFSPHFVDCDNPIGNIEYSKVEPFTSPYQIEKFEWIQTYNPRFIGNVKEALANNYPVIIGAQLTESFYDSERIWKYIESDYENDDDIYGHAMCVVGYDDEINGGSFRVVNSWGTDWADNGFVWINYDDFYEITDEAYVIKPFKIENNKKEKYIEFNEKYVSWISEDTNFTYEGQVNSNGMNGFGISSNRNGKGFVSVGNFIDGKQDGYHFAAFGDELYAVTYELGEVVKTEELGFAETKSPFDKQISRYGKSLKVKNPNSRVIDSLNNLKKGPVGKWKIKRPKETSK